MSYHPDKKHLHHRLLEIGHSQRRAVLIMWLWASLIAFGTVVASLFASTWTWVAIAAWAVATLAATFLLPTDPPAGSRRPSEALSRNGFLLARTLC